MNQFESFGRLYPSSVPAFLEACPELVEGSLLAKRAPLKPGRNRITFQIYALCDFRICHSDEGRISEISLEILHYISLHSE